MKKWLLALMICLSFASLTAGLFLLPKYIDISQSQNQKPEEDVPIHGSSHLYGKVYKYVANAQTGTTEIASGGGSIKIEHTDQNARYVNGTTYEASASETVNGVTTSGGDGHWEDKRGFNVIVTPSYGFYVSKIQIGDDTSFYDSSHTSTTTKTYDQSGIGVWGEVTKNIYIDFSRRDVSVTFNPDGGSARINTETEFAGYGNIVKKISSSTKKTIRFGQYFYVQTNTGVSDAYIKTGYTYSYTSVGGTTTYSTISGGGPSNYKRYYQTSYSSSLTVRVYWTINSYTLTAYANGGSISSTSGWSGTGNSATKSLNYNSAYGTLPSVSRTGYSLKGWYTDSSGGTKVSTTTRIGAGNTSIYAQWTINSYTLTANANGGSISSTSGWSGTGNTATKTLNYAASYGTLPNVSRTGYTFNGWFTASSGGSAVSTSTTMGASSTTIYAQWTINSYTLTANANSGSISSTTGWTGTGNTATKTLNYAASYSTLPNVSRTGYTLKGWYTASSGGNAVSTSTTMGASSTTIYAQWTINSYTLTAYANNGSISSTSGWSGTGSSTSKTLNYAAAYSTLPTVSRSNYNLKGWYTASSGGSAVSSTTTIGAGNANIYAQWTAISKTITLKGRVVGKNGTVANADNLGGSILTGTYTSVSDGATGSGTINQSANTYGYTMHQGSTLTITPTVASGYKYLGYSTNASTKPSVSSFPTSSSITVPTSNTTYYFYFQEVAAPLYYTTERGGYWYYEDGEYPQTYVGTSLSGTSATSSKFNINGTDYTVYTANGLKYIQVASPMTGSIKLNNGTTVSLTKGTKYWFRIDPIRWRVSHYGAASNKYDFASVTASLVGVSDILGHGRVNTTTSTFTKKDLKSEEMSAYTQSCSAVGYTNASTNMTYTFDKLIGDGSSSKTTTYTKSLAQASTLTVASLSDIQKATHNGTTQDNLKTYASDLAAMLQCRDYNNSTGWTSSIYNIGSGIVVGPGSGTRGAYWSDETNKFGFVFAHQSSYATCCGTR